MAQKPALPDSAEAVTVEWMQQAFAAGGAADLPALRGMAVQNIGTGVGLLGEILRCRLSDERSRKVAESGLERTLCAIVDLGADSCLPAGGLAGGISALSRGIYAYKKLL